MERFLVLENIRSAYNVGNLLRTADALWWKVIVSWFTPDPVGDQKVNKTALWSEGVVIERFWSPKASMDFLRMSDVYCVGAEITPSSVDLGTVGFGEKIGQQSWIALVLGNEKTGLLPETVCAVDLIVAIPMSGVKESLNVWQAGAICMWEINRQCWLMHPL